MYDITGKRVQCNCCKFESSGILCQHILRLFLALDVHTRVLHAETVDERSEEWFCFGRMFAV